MYFSKYEDIYEEPSLMDRAEEIDQDPVIEEVDLSEDTISPVTFSPMRLMPSDPVQLPDPDPVILEAPEVDPAVLDPFIEEQVLIKQEAKQMSVLGDIVDFGIKAVDTATGLTEDIRDFTYKVDDNIIDKITGEVDRFKRGAEEVATENLTKAKSKGLVSKAVDWIMTNQAVALGAAAVVVFLIFRR